MSEITFEFACRDDCLDKMVPSDLRGLVVERDRLRARLAEIEDVAMDRGFELNALRNDMERVQNQLAGTDSELIRMVELATRRAERILRLEDMLSGYTPIPAIPEGWLPIEAAPKDGTEIIGDYGNGDECSIVWSGRPVCMLGGRCGGFPPGWATSDNGDTDGNLPMDAPLRWRPIAAASQPEGDVK